MEDIKKIANEELFTEALAKAKKGIFLGYYTESKTLLILLTLDDMFELKNYVQKENKMGFFFKDKDGKEYSFERILDENEMIVLNLSNQVILSSSNRFFNKNLNEEIEYFSFSRKKNSVINF